MESAFPKSKEYKAVFCYGDTIYNPFGEDITPDLIAHEAVHVKQQGSTPDAWYIRYISDEKFRLKEEAEAYGEQYRFFSKYCKDRELVNHYLQDLARSLSGELYGNLCTFIEARNAIREYAKR